MGFIISHGISTKLVLNGNYVLFDAAIRPGTHRLVFTMIVSPVATSSNGATRRHFTGDGKYEKLFQK